MSVGAYTIFLYLFLFPAPRIYGVLRHALGDQGVRWGLLVLALLVTGAGFLRRGGKEILSVRALPGRVCQGGALLLLYLATTLLPNPAEKFHCLEYGILGALLGFYTAPRTPGEHFVRLFLGGVIGLGEELLQGATPNRYFEWKDVGFNTLGVVFGYLFARAEPKRGAALPPCRTPLLP